MNTLITGNAKFYSQTQNREYIEILRKNPPFKPEEEVEAFKRLNSGDDKALEEIVARNQRWVYSVAKEFARNEIEVMDYVQEGNVGLLKAIEKYDVERGLKFITYAVWYMRREMNAHMNDGRDIITKSNNAKLSKKLERIKNEFFVRNGYKASLDDIKEILKDKYDISIKNEYDLYDLEINSINDIVNDDTTFEECDDFTRNTATENEAVKNEDAEYYRELVIPLLHYLGEKEQDIIKKLYHIGLTDAEREKNAEYTFAEVCNEYNYDEIEMKKIESKILAYMRQRIKIIEYKKNISKYINGLLNNKRLFSDEKTEIINYLLSYYDTCFNENSSNYVKSETIEETIKRVKIYISNYMKEIPNVRIAI